MIVETEYNSRWWGERFGKVTDAAFFQRSRAKIRADLDAFSVVEFATDDLSCNQSAGLAELGFWWADSQIPFRLNLRKYGKSDIPVHLNQIRLVSAKEVPFSLKASDLPVFRAERFLQLSGATEQLLAQRYANWSNDLIAADPTLCLQAFKAGSDTPIGWFLGRALSASTIELTLAMNAPASPGTGGQLYEAALHHFGKAGFRLGQAAFSVQNTDVMNLYSHLGAKFQAPTHVWMWQRKAI